jgi:mono/diheme cytochrome c family protein
LHELQTSFGRFSAFFKPKNGHALQLISLVAIVALGCSLMGQVLGANNDDPVTPVEGKSWLALLHRPFNETSMGKTWELGPPPPMPGDEGPRWQLELSPGFGAQTVTLHGADLYLLSCRGCHGESGLGAPPEINSVIGPVQATSVEFTLARMKKAGRGMSRTDVTAIAIQSRILLQQRLHVGGQDMPAPTLNETEIRAIVAYLEQLSGIPGAEKRQITVRESSYRVGEHIAKSTCHVCHSATGPNPTPQQIQDGAIPPLGTLMTRVSLPDFVRKVTNGAPILMGAPPMLYRGRMPVFNYLSEDEAAYVYLYLLLYPPRK